MRSESNLVMELWELVRDQLPAARRQDIATAMLTAFQDFGFDSNDLKDIVDEDAFLTKSFYDVFDEELFDESEDYYDESYED